MVEIRKTKAFIAHSFLDEDKPLINKFLGYLDSFKDILEWEHAKEPQPMGLSNKVKEMMKDKDVFIGIFTRKYSIGIWTKKWLPSLWIVQESGYAVGKEMKLIFLVEDVISKNDLEGLQADYELIFFPRRNPEKSFDKINHMILEIFKRISKIEPYSTGVNPEENRQEEKKKSEKTEPLNLQLFKAIKEDQEEKTVEIFSKMMEESENDDEKCQNECWKFFVYHILKKKNVIADFDALIQKYPRCHYPYEYKGDVLKDLKEYQIAITCYEKAKEICTDLKDKLRIELEIAKTKRLSFNYEGLENKLNELLIQYQDNDSKSYLHEEFGHLYLERDKDKEKAIGCFEKALELKPDNVEIRFSIAYQYSELGNEEKALFYYRTYSDNKDGAGALNNLGVVYEGLKMPIKAVHYYKKSIEKKESLAMANLANKYINEGFIEEAKKLLNEALKCDEPHANVAKAFSRIQLLQEEEEKKEKEIIDSIVKGRVTKVS